MTWTEDVNREALVLFEGRRVLEPATQALRQRAAACPQTVWGDPSPPTLLSWTVAWMESCAERNESEISFGYYAELKTTGLHDHKKTDLRCAYMESELRKDLLLDALRLMSASENNEKKRFVVSPLRTNAYEKLKTSDRTIHQTLFGNFTWLHAWLSNT